MQLEFIFIFANEIYLNAKTNEVILINTKTIFNPKLPNNFLKKYNESIEITSNPI